MAVAIVNGRRLLYVHVPKTGGTSVVRLLSQIGSVRAEKGMDVFGRRFRPRHLHGEPLSQLFAPELFDWVFMTVRHPVSRLVSEYRYQRGRRGLWLADMVGFSGWLRYSLAMTRFSRSFRDNHFRPQAEFRVFDAEVFRVEDGLERLAARIGEVTGLTDLPRMDTRNRSNGPDVRPRASDLRLIEDFYRDDYRLFGYDDARTDEVTA